jgi:GDPmannose 4,6-dehydratase
LDWRDHVAIDEAFYRPSELDVIYGYSSKAKAKIRREYDLPFENLIKRLVEEELKHGPEVIRLNDENSI